MSDLVKRLRFYGGDDIRKEAADRIEALEAALREIAKLYLNPDQYRERARDALSDQTTLVTSPPEQSK